MKVQLLARFPKKKILSEEEKLQAEAQRIINGEESSNVFTLEFDYDDIVLDIKDVSEWIRFDKEHTQIMKYNNMVHMIKIPFEAFSAIYEEATGIIIKKVIFD